MTLLRRLREYGAQRMEFGADRTARTISAEPLFERQLSPILMLINEGVEVCAIKLDVSNANGELK
jgi:hypothetical protein